MIIRWILSFLLNFDLFRLQTGFSNQNGRYVGNGMGVNQVNKREKNK